MFVSKGRIDRIERPGAIAGATFDLPFWCMDKVKVKGKFDSDQYGPGRPYGEDEMPEIQFVGGIDSGFSACRDWSFGNEPSYAIYTDLDRRCCCYPTYTAIAHESQIALLERGNIWRFFHNEPMIGGIWEEARALMWLGMYSELSMYSDRDWEKGLFIEALQRLEVHGSQEEEYTLDKVLAGDSFSAVRLDDEEIGKRAAEAALEILLKQRE